MLPWLPEAMKEIDHLFGGDPWPYRLEVNRKLLDAFNQALVDDGFIPAPMKLEEVFVPVEGCSTWLDRITSIDVATSFAFSRRR